MCRLMYSITFGTCLAFSPATPAGAGGAAPHFSLAGVQAYVPSWASVGTSGGAWLEWSDYCLNVLS